MPLDWEELDSEYCYRASAPLFGSIRVERFSATRPWQIFWSVPGTCGLLIEGDWESAQAAMRAADEYVVQVARRCLGLDAQA